MKIKQVVPKEFYNRKCTVMGCNELHRANGFCGTHYAQSRRGISKDVMKPFKKRQRLNNAGYVCKVDGCAREAQRAQMCMAHYQRVGVHGDPLAHIPITIFKGWHYHKTGYVVIPSNGHPNGNAAGSIMEHVKIMSDYLGRPLEKNENVHHKNGIRDDNRLENLELWSKRQPTGSRVSDLITYAKEIIEKYGTDETKYKT